MRYISACWMSNGLPLHLACMLGHAASLRVNGAVVHALCEVGADMHALDSIGRTPLHYAAEMGFHPIVQVLLQAGAPTDVKDRAGDTPVDLAQRRGLTDIVAMLQKGAPAQP